MEVFTKLREARELLGYTQTEAAKLSGVRSKDISMLEAGKKKFVPDQYLHFLYNAGIDINSIYNPALQTAEMVKNGAETPVPVVPYDSHSDTDITQTPTLKQPGPAKYKAKSDPPTDPPTRQNANFGAQLAQPEDGRLLNEILTKISVLDARVSDIYTLLSKQR